MYVGNSFGEVSLLEVIFSTFGVVLVSGWTTVGPPLLPLALLTGVTVSPFGTSTTALWAVPVWLVSSAYFTFLDSSASLSFFSSSAFLYSSTS